MGKMYTEFLEIESIFIEGTNINIEELLKLNPDFVFYWRSYENQTKQLTEARTPSIGVVTQGNGSPLLTLQSWLQIMGDVFGQQNEVEDVIQYGNIVAEEIGAKTANIPEDSRIISV